LLSLNFVALKSSLRPHRHQEVKLYSLTLVLAKLDLAEHKN